MEDVGFLVAEFPTQYLAQHISRLGLYLGVNIMIWGLILGFHAACTTFAGLAIARTLLGIFESWYVLPWDGRSRLEWTLTCHLVLPRFWYWSLQCGTKRKSKADAYRGFMSATPSPKYSVASSPMESASRTRGLRAGESSTLLLGRWPSSLDSWLPYSCQTPQSRQRGSPTPRKLLRCCGLKTIKGICWELDLASSRTCLTWYQWYTKRSHQERPGLRDF